MAPFAGATAAAGCGLTAVVGCITMELGVVPHAVKPVASAAKMRNEEILIMSEH
jgi:hypothetical protein